MASIIPYNNKGKAVDIEHAIEENSAEGAIKMYERARLRIVNPLIWHLLTGAFGAKFDLYSTRPNDTKRLAKVDDYFKIDIPGPGLVSGEGFDWVKVELLEENSEPDCEVSTAMTLRASCNPQKPDEGTAHFFDGEATSTFIIKRIGKTVYASYHGRNEIANTVNIPLLDKLRNKVVATGAEAGLSELQWEALIKGFLQPEIGR